MSTENLISRHWQVCLSDFRLEKPRAQGTKSGSHEKGQILLISLPPKIIT